MSTNEPLVTVGVPLYNHQNYIEQCLESVVKQTYKNIEIIIIDDGSKDNSYQRAKKYLEKQNFNPNYKITSRANQGICNTLNEIAKRAKGKYFSTIASDDYWFENKIEEQVKFLEENLQYIFVHSNSIAVDEEGNKINYINHSGRKSSGSLFDEMIFGRAFINIESYLLRTTLYEKIGYYDPTLKVEDLDFLLRLTKKFEIGYIDQYHSYYRRHKDNFSNKKMRFVMQDAIIKTCKKNISDPSLLQRVLARHYRKALLFSLRNGRLFHFMKNLVCYLKHKY